VAVFASLSTLLCSAIVTTCRSLPTHLPLRTEQEATCKLQNWTKPSAAYTQRVPGHIGVGDRFSPLARNNGDWGKGGENCRKSRSEHTSQVSRYHNNKRMVVKRVLQINVFWLSLSYLPLKGGKPQWPTIM